MKYTEKYYGRKEQHIKDVLNTNGLNTVLTYLPLERERIEYGTKEIYLPDGVDTECGFDHYHIIPETVGQYTGLIDKNGQKIFEGDVIQTILKGKKFEKTFRFVIKYGAYIPEEYCKEEYAQHKTIGFYALSCSKKKHYQLSSYPKMLEVVGNIHDNPELLGGADNG